MTHFSPAATDDDPEPTPVFLAEYVNSELEADHMLLTDPLCSALMTEILALRETYAAAEASKIEELEKAGEERLSAEIAKLSETESSIPELEQAEQRLTEAIQADFDKALFEFSATWLGRQLSSHEDDGIRTLVCQMVAEPYTLSRYHRKTGTVQTACPISCRAPSTSSVPVCSSSRLPTSRSASSPAPPTPKSWRP